MPKSSTFSFAARPRWTEEDACAALAAFARSGLSMGAFAAEAEIKLQRLARWDRQMRSEAAATRKRVSFVEVRPRDAERARIEIVLPSGCVLRCTEEISASALRRVVGALEDELAC